MELVPVPLPVEVSGLDLADPLFSVVLDFIGVVLVTVGADAAFGEGLLFKNPVANFVDFAAAGFATDVAAVVVVVVAVLPVAVGVGLGCVLSAGRDEAPLTGKAAADPAPDLIELAAAAAAAAKGRRGRRGG